MLRLFSWCVVISLIFLFFFFNDTATTEIYTLSLHDALPIWLRGSTRPERDRAPDALDSKLRHGFHGESHAGALSPGRSEEHTSELQSRLHLVCRLLLEKKKKKNTSTHNITYAPTTNYDMRNI